MTRDRVRVPGLEAPLRIYFFADTHLQAHAPDDPHLPPEWRDNPTPVLPCAGGDLLASHLRRAVDGGADLILMGGDLFHFPTLENRDLALAAFDACPAPVRAIPGNHDWFYPGQDGWEELRDRQRPRLDPVFGPTPAHWAETVRGLRILGLDNSTYFLSREQSGFLASELDRDGPVLLMMHIPLSTPALREATIRKHGSPILMADPAGRTREGVDPEPTLEAAARIRTAPNLVGILAAHVHLPFREEVAPGRFQWIPEAGYRDGFQWLDIDPA